MSDIVIFGAESQQVELRLEGDAVWLSLQQLAELFGRDKGVISRHLKNIFENDALDRPSVVAKNGTTASDRKTCQVEYDNFDLGISAWLIQATSSDKRDGNYRGFLGSSSGGCREGQTQFRHYNLGNSPEIPDSSPGWPSPG